MPATLTQLLARTDLGLRLLTPADTAALDRPIPWAHSSELADPTPFLSEGQLLLVTGTPDDVEPYVARLVDARHRRSRVRHGGRARRNARRARRGVLRQGLPLFEVPYRIPFIAIARFIADRVAADAYARSTWALERLPGDLARSAATGRARLGPRRARPPARARRRPRRRDRSRRPRLPGQRPRSGCTRIPLRRRPAAAARTPASGQHGSARAGVVRPADHRRGRPPPRDPRRGRRHPRPGRPAGRHRRRRARGPRPRTDPGDGCGASPPENSRLACAPGRRPRHRGGRCGAGIGALPSGPLRLALFSGAPVDAAAEWLELHPAPFFARNGHDLVVLLEAGSPAEPDAISEAQVPANPAGPANHLASELAARFDLRAGVSAPATIDTLPAALAQAIASRDRTTAEAPVGAFDDLAGGGMLALLQTADARAVAAASLAPLAGDPALARDSPHLAGPQRRLRRGRPRARHPPPHPALPNRRSRAPPRPGPHPLPRPGRPLRRPPARLLISGFSSRRPPRAGIFGRMGE